MLSKISVKKPMTVLVAVVLVLVLGIVSFFKMTPDLLPNMDFPYAVIMTTYAGQTPEAVETTVSKPLEQSMSAIDGVKEITSTSSDNYSLLMIEFEDGTKIYERIDAHALDGADMSDVIMQYDHEGRVFARQSNKTLILQPDYKGLKVAADLGKTDLARGLYQDIEAGMINKMSWAFSVAEESYDRETHTRTILKIKKVYDVSAVSIPANGDTEISARAFASRSYEQERQELLKRRAAILKIRASL